MPTPEQQQEHLRLTTFLRELTQGKWTWSELQPKLERVLADKKSRAAFNRLLSKPHGWLAENPSSYTFKFEGQMGPDPEGKKDKILLRVRPLDDDPSVKDIVIVFDLVIGVGEDDATYLFIDPEAAHLRRWLIETQPTVQAVLPEASSVPALRANVSSNWIEMVERLRNFSLKGIRQLLVPAFQDDEHESAEVVLAIRARIRNKLELAIIDTHAPLFLLAVTGVYPAGTTSNGHAKTLNISYQSQVPDVDPKNPKFEATLLLEHGEADDALYVKPGSMMVISDIEYLPESAMTGEARASALTRQVLASVARPVPAFARKLEMTVEATRWSELEPFMPGLISYFPGVESRIHQMWTEMAKLLNSPTADYESLTLFVKGEISPDVTKTYLMIELRYTGGAFVFDETTEGEFDTTLRYAWEAHKETGARTTTL
jgi:hypothetical protein